MEWYCLVTLTDLKMCCAGLSASAELLVLHLKILKIPKLSFWYGFFPY